MEFLIFFAIGFCICQSLKKLGDSPGSSRSSSSSTGTSSKSLDDVNPFNNKSFGSADSRDEEASTSETALPINQESGDTEKNAPEFSTVDQLYAKIEHITLDNPQQAIKMFYPGQALSLNIVPDIHNIKWVAVYSDNNRLGYLDKRIGNSLMDHIKYGSGYSCMITDITDNSGEIEIILKIVKR